MLLLLLMMQATFAEKEAALAQSQSQYIDCLYAAATVFALTDEKTETAVTASIAKCEDKGRLYQARLASMLVAKGSDINAADRIYTGFKTEAREQLTLHVVELRMRKTAQAKP